MELQELLAPGERKEMQESEDRLEMLVSLGSMETEEKLVLLELPDVMEKWDPLGLLEPQGMQAHRERWAPEGSEARGENRGKMATKAPRELQEQMASMALLVPLVSQDQLGFLEVL